MKVRVILPLRDFTVLMCVRWMFPFIPRVRRPGAARGITDFVDYLCFVKIISTLRTLGILDRRYESCRRVLILTS